jgi:hypothetical protein
MMETISLTMDALLSTLSSLLVSSIDWDTQNAVEMERLSPQKHAMMVIKPQTMAALQLVP